MREDISAMERERAELQQRLQELQEQLEEEQLQASAQLQAPPHAGGGSPLPQQQSHIQQQQLGGKSYVPPHGMPHGYMHPHQHPHMPPQPIPYHFPAPLPMPAAPKPLPPLQVQVGESTIGIMIWPSSSDNGKLVVTGIKEDKSAGQSVLQVGDSVAKQSVLQVGDSVAKIGDFDVDGMDASEVATKLIGTSGSNVTFVTQKGVTISYIYTALWNPHSQLTAPSFTKLMASPSSETITELEDLSAFIKEKQRNLQALQESIEVFFFVVLASSAFYHLC
jgi:hypothetical protein